MNVKRKYLFWLIPAVLVLLAVLFSSIPAGRTRSCICRSRRRVSARSIS